MSLWNDQELLSLQVNPDDIEDVRKLGTGAFGVVYLAKYRKNKLVACKRLKKGEATYENTQSFIAEIKLCATLDHPRVVQLLGVAWTIESDLQAMFEYMSNGDLRTYLEKTKSSPGTGTPRNCSLLRTSQRRWSTCTRSRLRSFTATSSHATSCCLKTCGDT